MRVMIMFDLPVETKKQRRIYSKFRKRLLENGFLMMQYSIYIKSVANKDAADFSVLQIKQFLPQDGHVRSLIKQNLHFFILFLGYN
mgnify:CR=1 FL=1